MLRDAIGARVWAVLLVAVGLAAPARADEEHPPHAHHARAAARADAHAPIGVMGDHLHPAGGVMLSYRFVRMDMDGNRDGSHRVSTTNVLSAYPVSPTDMDMEAHVLGVMWAPHGAVTLTTMIPFRRLDMNHRTRMGARFTTRTSGIGDVQVGGLVRLLAGERHRLHLNAGVSVPTGSISEKDDTPMGRVRLPYPMQLGSGTWDLLPGLTYSGLVGDWSWGAQALGTVRMGLNRKGYRLGNRWQTTTWLARSWSPAWSTSLRLGYAGWDDIHGDDDALMPAMVPTADPDLRGGRRLDLLLGVNLLVTRGPFQGHRLAVEVGRPLYQHLNGPQLETDWTVTAGWQLAFH